MFARARWFSAGLIVGSAGAAYTYFRAREAMKRHIPENAQQAALQIAQKSTEVVGSALESAVGSANETVDGWRDSIAQSRQMRKRAEELLQDQLDAAGL
ncbi:MAG: hypothetical protein RLZZ31_1971 [Actinomycetota bacterium]|jgi:hypothetical protein